MQALDPEQDGRTAAIVHEILDEEIYQDRDNACVYRGLDHLTASEQLEVLGRLLEALRSTRRRLQKYSTPAGLGYEELGGLSDTGQHRVPEPSIPTSKPYC